MQSRFKLGQILGREIMADKKLTKTKVEAEHGPARLSDGRGLYLVVRRPAKGQRQGTKSWSFVWIRQGRRREMGLGGYPALSLKNAREKADQVRNQIAIGQDPRTERDKTQSKTFGEVADVVLEDISKTWKHPKHGAQWIRALTELSKPIRKMQVADVNTADVLRVVKPIYDKTPETGRRLRARIERVLDYALAHGLRTGDNPARLNAHFKILLGSKKAKARKHYAAMPYVEVPAFIQELKEKGTIPARALEFTILTAARTGETLGATWEEIDLEAGLWTIPSLRMKAGVTHAVPLSDPALAILKELYVNRLSNYVFAGQQPRKPLSNMTMAMTMRRMGVSNERASVHGFRSSFRDWAGDCTNTPREVAEAALAHRVGNIVEQSYRRGDALFKRRRLMSAWAEYCLSNKTSVVEFKQVRG